MTVVASAKAKLLGASNVLAALPGMQGVIISYSPPRDILRECVYGGRVTGPVELKAMAAGARVKRAETLTLQLFVRVWHPGEQTTEAAEARAAAIGDLIALHIAGDWTLGGLDGLKKAFVAALELDGWVDDDGAGAVLTMSVGLESYLT